MTRWRVAAAIAGLLAACIAAVPAQAAEWCIHDPQLVIQMPRGGSVTVYVTEGALGSQHQAALASAWIGYTTRSRGHVTIYDYIPSDLHGSFPTEMIVSSQPYGAGTVYGSTFGRSGSTMVVSFNVSK
jgi:hypothetical protein